MEALIELGFSPCKSQSLRNTDTNDELVDSSTMVRFACGKKLQGLKPNDFFEPDGTAGSRALIQTTWLREFFHGSKTPRFRALLLQA
jgi:hypothetical protein